MLVTSEMAVCLCTPYSSEWSRTDQELPFVRSGVISSEESKLQNTQTTENVKVHKQQQPSGHGSGGQPGDQPM